MFFIISGYFLYKENGFTEKLRKSIRKIFRLLLWSTFVFFLYSLFLALASGDFSDFNIITPKRIIGIIFLDSSIFGMHLWYIWAYLYVLIIFYFIETHVKIKFSMLFVLVPILLLCACCLGKYCLLLTGHEISTILTRNFLFAGIPYFLVGIFIKKYYSKIKNITHIHKVAFCGVIFFMITSVLEKYFLYKIGMLTGKGDYYISTPFLSTSLFLYFLTLKPMKNNVVARIGCKDSLFIYIYHPIFLYLSGVIALHILPYVFPPSAIDIYKSLNLIFVLIYTLIFIYGCRKFGLIKK